METVQEQDGSILNTSMGESQVQNGEEVEEKAETVIAEVARLLGSSQKRVWDLISTGKLVIHNHRDGFELNDNHRTTNFTLGQLGHGGN